MPSVWIPILFVPHIGHIIRSCVSNETDEVICNSEITN